MTDHPHKQNKLFELSTNHNFICLSPRKYFLSFAFLFKAIKHKHNVIHCCNSDVFFEHLVKIKIIYVQLTLICFRLKLQHFAFLLCSKREKKAYRVKKGSWAWWLSNAFLFVLIKLFVLVPIASTNAFLLLNSQTWMLHHCTNIATNINRVL